MATAIYKAKVIDNGHTFYFVTRNKDVSQLSGLWARHCSDCCKNVLTDLQVFSHHVAQAKVEEYQTDANKV